jgi:hypothetical protein
LNTKAGLGYSSSTGIISYSGVIPNRPALTHLLSLPLSPTIPLPPPQSVPNCEFQVMFPKVRGPSRGLSP